MKRVDERLIQHYVDQEWSGDYVLSGGELPAMVLLDSIIRRLNVMSDEQSAIQDSLWMVLLIVHNILQGQTI